MWEFSGRLSKSQGTKVSLEGLHQASPQHGWLPGRDWSSCPSAPASSFGLWQPHLVPLLSPNSARDGGIRGLALHLTSSYSRVKGEFLVKGISGCLRVLPSCFIIKPGSCFAFQNFDGGLVWKSKTGPGWFFSLPSRSDGPNSPLPDVGTPD